MTALPFRPALRGLFAAAAVAALTAIAMPQPGRAQAPEPAPPAAAPAQNAQPDDQGTPLTSTAQPGDAFGESTALTAKTVIYVKGSGTWDKAFDTITASLRKVRTYLDKEGIKPDGMAMTVFTATDDNGFDYQAAIPIAQAPKNPPHGDIAMGQSPEGQALKFVHRGSYEDLDNTYEAITNYLDDKRMEAKDMFIEEYVTDPVGADPKKLVVNVYVLIKPPGTSPG